MLVRVMSKLFVWHGHEKVLDKTRNALVNCVKYSEAPMIHCLSAAINKLSFDVIVYVLT